MWSPPIEGGKFTEGGEGVRSSPIEGGEVHPSKAGHLVQGKVGSRSSKFQVLIITCTNWKGFSCDELFACDELYPIPNSSCREAFC